MQFPTAARDLYLLRNVQTGFGTHANFLLRSRGTGGVSGLQRSGRECGHFLLMPRFRTRGANFHFPLRGA